MRALYQRNKGRDLFDLYHALIQAKPDTVKIITCYKEYMSFSDGRAATAKEFILNMDHKINDDTFLGDIEGLLRPKISYDDKKAYELIRKELLEKI